MNDENLKNVLIIDLHSKEVLNEPEIEIDQEVYDEAINKLVEELLLGLKQGVDLKNFNPRSVFLWRETKREKVWKTFGFVLDLWKSLWYVFVLKNI